MKENLIHTTSDYMRSPRVEENRKKRKDGNQEICCFSSPANLHVLYYILLMRKVMVIESLTTKPSRKQCAEVFRSTLGLVDGRNSAGQGGALLKSKAWCDGVLRESAHRS